MQAIIKGHLFQSASLECTGSNRLNRIRNINARKTWTFVEQARRDFCDTLLKGHLAQISAVHEIGSTGIGLRQTFRNFNSSQRRTVLKSTTSQALQSFGQTNCLQVCAIVECFCTDSNHRIWQNNTGQLCTVKNIGFNGLQAIVQGNIFQSAPLKGTGSNRYDRIRNVNAH